LYFLIVWLGVFTAAWSAHAEVNSNTTTVGDESQSLATAPTSALELGIHSSQYLDRGQPFFREGAADSNNSFLLRTSGQTHSKIKATWDLESEYSGSEHWNYFRPREAYVSYGDLSLGRRKLTYSNWEDQWNQGLFEPRFMDDKLHSSKAGLVGLFIERQHEYLRWRVAYLPVYLPDMTPHFWIGDEKLRSYNPWFVSPPSKFQYRGSDHGVDYSVNEPDIAQVVFKQGAMGQVEWKPSEKTAARFSYAYKPMPQILEAFPINEHFNLPTEIMHVDLQPRFLYHHVANLDFNYSGAKNQLGLSVAGEHPVSDPTPSDWETQSVGDAMIVSAYHSFNFDAAKTWTFTSSLLKVWGGDRKDQGDIESSVTLFERRYQYTEAASVALRKFWGAKRVESGFKVIFDRLQNGLVYSGDLTARLHKSLAVSMAFDLFQILPGEPISPDGFIDVYRGNDRLSLGMSYVF
jgi:hypothetical protein